ncbi:MAG: hypothetical protein J6B87_01180 [Clostridia bacterium]|nr:hypothetical protein [Clostridia bacterium]
MEILIILFLISFIRYTPFGTAVIVDRKTHYCKTKPRGGFYFFNPFTDKVTTYISTTPYTKYYSDIFETNDTKYLKVSFSVTYHAESVDAVLLHLKNDKRSIDDIIKCAVDSTLSSFDQKYIYNNRPDITQEIKNRMALACIPFGFIIDSFGITQIMSMPDSSANQKFTPHVCRDDGPIKFSR